MTLTLHHLKNGTFAAEVPSPDGPQIVFSSNYASDANRESQYTVLAALLKLAFGLVIPPAERNEPHGTRHGSEDHREDRIAPRRTRRNGGI